MKELPAIEKQRTWVQRAEKNKVKVGACCRKSETRATDHATSTRDTPRAGQRVPSLLLVLVVLSYPSPHTSFPLRLLIALRIHHARHGLYNLPTV